MDNNNSWLEQLMDLLRGQQQPVGVPGINGTPIRNPNPSPQPGTPSGVVRASYDQQPQDPYFYQKLRASLPANDPRQAELGPLEHGEFTQETVEQNPWMALPLAVATPAYTAGKALGLIQARSPASLEEMLQAYKGIGRGMLNVAGASRYNDAPPVQDLLTADTGMLTAPRVAPAAGSSMPVIDYKPRRQLTSI